MTNAIKLTIALLILTLTVACGDDRRSFPQDRSQPNVDVSFEDVGIENDEDVGLETDSNVEEDASTETDTNVTIEEDVKNNTDTNVPEEDTGLNTDTNPEEDTSPEADTNPEEDTENYGPECVEGDLYLQQTSIDCIFDVYPCIDNDWGQEKIYTLNECPTTCDPGDTRPCNTEKEGRCAEGTITCDSQGEWEDVCKPVHEPLTGVCISKYDSCGKPPSVGNLTCADAFPEEGYDQGSPECGEVPEKVFKGTCTSPKTRCTTPNKWVKDQCMSPEEQCLDNKHVWTNGECRTPQEECELVEGNKWVDDGCFTPEEHCEQIQYKVWVNGQCAAPGAEAECIGHGDIYHEHTGRCEVVCNEENTYRRPGPGGSVVHVNIEKQEDLEGLIGFKCLIGGLTIEVKEGTSLKFERVEGIILRKILEGSFYMRLDHVDPDNSLEYLPSMEDDFLQTFKDLVEVDLRVKFYSSISHTQYSDPTMLRKSKTAAVNFNDLTSLEWIGRLEISALKSYNGTVYDLTVFRNTYIQGEVDIYYNSSICQLEALAVRPAAQGWVGDNTGSCE